MEREAHKKLMIDLFGKTEEEIAEMFNSGMFNNFTYGAMIITLKNIGIPEEKIEQAIAECRRVFDETTATELLDAYKKR